MFAYNKFIVAIVGFAMSWLTKKFGIDFEAMGLNAQDFVALITAIAVWAVPNLPKA